MELWIRTQNKETLIKTSDIYLNDNVAYKTEKQRFMRTDNTGKHYETLEDVKVIDKFICCEVWGDRTLLGSYKTKERALEVLDEIQKYLIPNIELLDEKLNGKQVCQIGNILTMVYQMPEE